MRVLAVLMTTLLLAGCGSAGPGLTEARHTRSGGVESQSLAGDIARKLAPIAARKAVEAGIKVAVKNDDKALAEFKAKVSQKPGAEQVAFLNKRLKSLQRAVTGAEVALAANVALAKRDDVAAVREALEAAKAEDKTLAKAYDEKAPDAEKIAYLLKWGEVLHDGLVKASASF